MNAVSGTGRHPVAVDRAPRGRPVGTNLSRADTPAADAVIGNTDFYRAAVTVAVDSVTARF